MSSEEQSECQQKAEVAMRMAIAARGLERHIWARMALLWQGLGGAKGRDKGHGDDTPKAL